MLPRWYAPLPKSLNSRAQAALLEVRSVYALRSSSSEERRLLRPDAGAARCTMIS
jgi:hypothetical protein